MTNFAKNRRKIACLLFVLVFAAALMFAANGHVRAIASHRASIFFTIDWLIKQEIGITGEAPESIDMVVAKLNSRYYADLFPGGLLYRRNGNDKYRLWQRGRASVTIFCRDRLISSQDNNLKYENGKFISK